MASRKFLFFNDESGKGFYQDHGTGDTFSLYELTMNGDIALGGNLATGVAAGTTSGEALVWGQSNAELPGLTLVGALAMGGNKVVSLPNGSASSDSVTKGQLDAAQVNTQWKDGVSSINVIDDTVSATPSNPSHSDAYFVGPSPTGQWATEGFAEGDLVEWDENASSWTKLVANSGGNPPTDTRVCVTTSETAGGSFAGEEGEIATWGGSSWSFYDPTSGDAVMVYDGDSVYGWCAFIWNQSASWSQISAASDIIAGDGLSRTGNTIDVNFGDGVELSSDYVAVKLDATGGLQFDSGSEHAKKIEVFLNASNPGLEFSTGLKVSADGAHGIHLSSGKLAIETDATLATGSDGLYVAGMPTNFNIDGVATDGANVTAANLNSLVATSEVSIHTHTFRYDAQCSNPSLPNPSYAITSGKGVCYLEGSPNGLKHASNDTEDECSRFAGVASETASAGNNARVTTRGKISGTGLTAGKAIYLTSSGTLSDSPPEEGGGIVFVGATDDAGDLYVNPHFLGYTELLLSMFTTKTTAERQALGHSEGQIIYDTDLDLLFTDDGTRWQTDGPVPDPDLEDEPNYELLRCQIESVQRKVGSDTTAGAVQYVHGATTGATIAEGSVYSPTERKIYLCPYGLGDTANWIRFNCVTGDVEEFADPSTSMQDLAFRGGAYSPELDRIYFAPWNQSDEASWAYINCKTGVATSYGHGSSCSSNNAFIGAVHSPTQGRIYFTPWEVSDETNWYYVDCSDGSIDSYAHGTGLSTSGAFWNGCYDPYNNIIWFMPAGIADESTWYRIDCDDGSVDGYAHGLGSITDYGFSGGVYDPYNNYIWMTPWAASDESNWLYIDCSDLSLNSYAHGAGSLVNNAYYGGVYDPMLNRVWMIPDSIGTQTTWHYIDCTSKTVVGYTHGVSTTTGSVYRGGSYDPINNRVWFSPYAQGTQTDWHYIQNYAQERVSSQLMAHSMFNMGT